MRRKKRALEGELEERGSMPDKTTLDELEQAKAKFHGLEAELPSEHRTVHDTEQSGEILDEAGDSARRRSRASASQTPDSPKAPGMNLGDQRKPLLGALAPNVEPAFSSDREHRASKGKGSIFATENPLSTGQGSGFLGQLRSRRGGLESFVLKHELESDDDDRLSQTSASFRDLYDASPKNAPEDNPLGKAKPTSKDAAASRTTLIAATPEAPSGIFASLRIRSNKQKLDDSSGTDIKLTEDSTASGSTAGHQDVKPKSSTEVDTVAQQSAAPKFDLKHGDPSTLSKKGRKKKAREARQTAQNLFTGAEPPQKPVFAPSSTVAGGLGTASSSQTPAAPDEKEVSTDEERALAIIRQGAAEKEAKRAK
ncbi:MAG: hypothetical protein Q9225_005419 [Loekoesia sp. 1 TL-2023]